MGSFFSFPIPRDYPKFRLLGGVARSVILLHGDAKSHKLMAPFFTYHLMPERKNHLDDAGIEPGPPA